MRRSIRILLFSGADSEEYSGIGVFFVWTPYKLYDLDVSEVNEFRPDSREGGRFKEPLDLSNEPTEDMGLFERETRS